MQDFLSVKQIKVFIFLLTFLICGVSFLAVPLAVVGVGSEAVDIPTDGGWGDLVFGGGSLELDIFRPKALGAESSIWSVGGLIVRLLFIAIWVGGVASVIIGGIKAASGGDQTQQQAAQKWMKNALIGTLASGGIFILANIATFALGFGSVWNLSENFAVCRGKALYEYKRENPSLLEGDVTCECNGGWSCK